MDLLYTWRTLYTLRYCPVTLIQTAFSAGTVHLLAAKQAISGTRLAQKELRHSYSEATLTLQYLDEIGKTWACATKVTETLRSLLNEHIRPHLDHRKFIPASTAEPPISGDIGDGGEENDSRPSRSLSRSSQAMNSHQVAHSHSRTRSSGSGQSSLSTSLNHPLYSTPVPAQVSPSAQPLTSPTITISPAHDADAPSASIAIRSPRSPSSGPSTFPDSLSLQPNFSTSPSSSFVHRARDYAQPFSNYIANPFSSNGDGSSDNIGHPFGSQGSFSVLDFQSSLGPSSTSPYLGMLGGQTISNVPSLGLTLPDWLQAPAGTGFSQADTDNMELDSMLWDSFGL